MNHFLFSGLFTSITVFSLGLFVLFAKWPSKLVIIFFLYSLSIAVWGLSVFFHTPDLGAIPAFWWGRLLHVGVILIPAFFYHFVTIFLNIEKKRKKFIVLSYITACFFELLLPTNLLINGVEHRPEYSFPRPGLLYNVWFLSLLMTVIAGISELINRVRVAKGRERQQIFYFLFSSMIGYAGGFDNFFITKDIHIFPLYPFGAYAVVFYVFVMAYAILKHQLMDIRVIIKRTLIYSSLVFLISVGYVSAIFIAHQIFMGELSSISVFKRSVQFSSLPALIGTLSFAGLGIFAFFNKPRTETKVIFTVLCFQTFYWELVWFASFLTDSRWLVDYLGKVVYLTITPMPFTFYHLIVTYLKRKSEIKYVITCYVFSGILMLLLFPTNLFVVGSQYFEWGKFSRPGPLYILFVAGALASMIRGLIILWDSYHRSRGDADTQNQIKYLLLGLGIFFFCSLDFFQVYGASWFPIGTFFFILSFVVIVYAISRHHLLDMNVAIKRTLFYSFITVIISLVYLLAVFVFHSVFLQGGEKAPSFLASFLAILFIAITFKPLEIALHHLMERKFFKGTIAEIAEQKQKLETELERRERLKSVGILAAGMAHEIKNPLSAIKTFNEYLLEKHADPEFVKKFQRIVGGEVNKIDHIVRQLLEFARPKPPVLKPVDIRELLNDTLDLLNSDCLKRHVTVLRQWTDGPLMIQADKEQLRQVFLNLILNSLEAMSDGGELTVNCELTTDGRITVTITDIGLGIPADKLPHIFDPFFTTKEEGTGLGLAIVHGIIQQHKGEIKVQSEAGKGTTVRVRFPAIT